MLKYVRMSVLNAHLGEKLKSLAESEAKKFNAAYVMLKDSGYI